jgi:hypothetical protein
MNNNKRNLKREVRVVEEEGAVDVGVEEEEAGEEVEEKVEAEVKAVVVEEEVKVVVAAAEGVEEENLESKHFMWVL